MKIIEYKYVETNKKLIINKTFFKIVLNDIV